MKKWRLEDAEENDVGVDRECCSNATARANKDFILIHQNTRRRCCDSIGGRQGTESSSGPSQTMHCRLGLFVQCHRHASPPIRGPYRPLHHDWYRRLSISVRVMLKLHKELRATSESSILTSSRTVSFIICNWSLMGCLSKQLLLCP